jgi:hypothetical protein
MNDLMNQEIQNLKETYDPPLDDWTATVLYGMKLAVKREIAELRRLKLPVIVSQNGKPVDINPDTNPEAPPWKGEN